MARPFVLGRDHKLYYIPSASRDPSLTRPGPWAQYYCADQSLADLTEVNIVQDLTVGLPNETAEAGTRASGKWAQNVVVMGSADLNFGVLWRPSHPVFADLFARSIDGCPIAMLIADAAPISYTDAQGAPTRTARCNTLIEASYGLWADFVITGFDWNQNRNEPATADVTMELGLGAIVPEAVQLWPVTDNDISPLSNTPATCA